MENKRKHLEFLQSVIARLNTNSFLLKAWAATLVSALFALAAKDANAKVLYVSCIVIPAFWILDGFFLAAERRYRDLYSIVAGKAEEDVDFGMDPSSSNVFSRKWVGGVVSLTLLIFYGTLIVASLAVRYFAVG